MADIPAQSSLVPPPPRNAIASHPPPHQDFPDVTPTPCEAKFTGGRKKQRRKPQELRFAVHLERVATGKMNKERPVWVPDNEHGFRLGKIVDIGSDTITVELLNGSKGQVSTIRSIWLRFPSPSEELVLVSFVL